MKAMLAQAQRPARNIPRRMHTSLTYTCACAHDLRDTTFVAEAAKLWSTEERLEFFGWIAAQPEAGTVVPGSGGCRKVRWSRPDMGKRGGARVIYFARLHAGELCMLLVYPKAARDDISGHILKAVREEIEDDRT